MTHIKKIDACKQFCVHEKVLNNAVVSDNRKFWQTISPLFSEKAFRKATFRNCCLQNVLTGSLGTMPENCI